MKNTYAIGLVNGQFTPCKPSPNGVSSMEKSKRHFTEPFSYKGNTTAAIDKILNLVAKLNFKIILNNEDYIHCAVKTKFGNFIDDIEFYFPKNESLVHIKSTSRKGYYDFGANRRRVEKLRKLFNS